MGRQEQMWLKYLPTKERKVLVAVRRHHAFYTRLRERSGGDEEYVQIPPPQLGFDPSFNPDVDVPDEEIVTCLRSLSSRGLVESSAGTVHPFDSSEYIYQWTIPGGVAEDMDTATPDWD